MFQSFESSARPEQGPPRLFALRGLIAETRLDGWLVPRADVHQGEYVARCDQRLAWLTGFTGSAGFAAITAQEAGVFIDGRYRTQVKSEVAAEFTPVPWPEMRLADWLIRALPDGGSVGYDPNLHTIDEITGLITVLTPSGIRLTPRDNLIDQLWQGRPPPPDAPFFDWPEAHAGEATETRRIRIAQTLRAEDQRAAILTLPDSIAWLLNIRGRDVEKNPVPHAFAILHEDGRVDLFARPGKAAALTPRDGLTIHDVADFPKAIAALKGPVRVDPKSAPDWIARILDKAGVDWQRGADPCLLPKARKNPVEIQGMRAAHLRDGAAMVRFLAWLDREAPTGGETEISVVRALEGFRRATNALLDISFDTIAGAGPHGAVVHYRVTEATDRPIRGGDLLLVDSGGQYIDGTTDITRTIAVGPPPADAAPAYTRVLQGMIAISRARFPHLPPGAPGAVTGGHLDSLARYPLWLAGQDFDHGTGHGVGVYLSVHEGPQRLSRASDVVLEPGMILSNEPGYYRESAFGIRIENLIVVQEEGPPQGGDPHRRWLSFETLTWAPLDRRLIVAEMLDRDEKSWIDAYHEEVLHRIAPLVEGMDQDWLRAACAPL